MNQCMTDRCRHPAVFGSEFIQCGHGSRIAQHNGNLPATSDAGGLALRAGLGGHWLTTHERFALRGATFLILGTFAKLFGRVVIDFVARLFSLRLHASQHGRALPVGVRQVGVVAAEYLGNLVDGELHVVLHGGPIPPMSESYAVTSDVSTLILQAQA